MTTPLDVDRARGELRLAVVECSCRGLVQSALWASEVLQGLLLNPTSTPPSRPQVQHAPQEVDSDYYFIAKSLFDNKEYSRCSHLLSTSGECPLDKSKKEI